MNPNYLQSFRSQLEQDFEIQFGQTEEICKFLLKDWTPQLALIDGDSMGNLTAEFRQQMGYPKLGIMVTSENPGTFKEEYAFRTGADHFINSVKDYKSIIWRFISLMRKTQNHNPAAAKSVSSDGPASSIVYRNLKIHPQDFLVKADGRVVKITPIQFKLLVAFIMHPDQLLSREWIKEHIWENTEISPRSIDAQISKLKKVLPDIGDDIMNIYGQGYLLSSGNKSAA